MSPSLHIRDGLVLLEDAQRPQPADLVISGGRIADILPPGSAVDAAEHVDARERLIIPGLVNAHTHGQFTLSRGLNESWTLEHLLNAFPHAGGGRSRAEFHRVATLLSAADSIRNGCTSLYDLFSEFPVPTSEGVGAVVGAYAEAGLRATVAPMMADRSFYSAIPGLLEALPAELAAEADRVRFAPHHLSIERCRALFENWPASRDSVRPALAPTIPHHCSDDFLRACRDLAREFDVGVQMHVAESRMQAVVAPTVHGATAVAHLDRLGLLGPHFTAAHGVWLGDEDIRRLGDRGASIAHNAGSNLRLGSGIAPARRFLDAGVNLAIGTDSAITGDSLGMFEATRLAALVSRMPERDPERWLSAAEAFRAATVGGAAALGFGSEFGVIARGKAADLVLLDLAHGPLVPLRNAVNQMVYAESGAGVRSVFVNGRRIYEDGEFLCFDYPSVVEQARAMAEEIDMATRSAAAFVSRLEPFVAAFCAGLAARKPPVHCSLCRPAMPSDPQSASDLA